MQLRHPRPPRPPQIQTQVERDLVIARTPGVQLPRHLADYLAESALDRGVDVLIRRQVFEGPRLGFGLDCLEPNGECLRLVGREHPDGTKHRDMGE